MLASPTAPQALLELVFRRNRSTSGARPKRLKTLGEFCGRRAAAQSLANFHPSQNPVPCSPSTGALCCVFLSAPKIAMSVLPGHLLWAPRVPLLFLPSFFLRPLPRCCLSSRRFPSRSPQLPDAAPASCCCPRRGLGTPFPASPFSKAGAATLPPPGSDCKISFGCFPEQRWVWQRSRSEPGEGSSQHSARLRSCPSAGMRGVGREITQEKVILGWERGAVGAGRSHKSQQGLFVGSPLGEGCFQSVVVLLGLREMRDVGDVIGAPAMLRDGAGSLAGTRSPDVLPAQQGTAEVAPAGHGGGVGGGGGVGLGRVGYHKGRWVVPENSARLKRGAY